MKACLLRRWGEGGGGERGRLSVPISGGIDCDPGPYLLALSKGAREGRKGEKEGRDEEREGGGGSDRGRGESWNTRSEELDL